MSNNRTIADDVAETTPTPLEACQTRLATTLARSAIPRPSDNTDFVDDPLAMVDRLVLTAAVSSLGSHHFRRFRCGPPSLIRRTGMPEVPGAFTLLSESSEPHLSCDHWRLCRFGVEALVALLTSAQQVRRGDVDGTQPSVSLGQLRLDFFMLPPPRFLRRGLVGLWLVAVVAHFNCTYDVFRSEVQVHLPLQSLV